MQDNNILLKMFCVCARGIINIYGKTFYKKLLKLQYGFKFAQQLIPRVVMLLV